MMVLTTYDQQFPVFHEEGFQISVSFQWWLVMEDANVFYAIMNSAWRVLNVEYKIVGNMMVINDLSSQMASNMEYISMSWHHNDSE